MRVTINWGTFKAAKWRATFEGGAANNLPGGEVVDQGFAKQHGRFIDNCHWTVFP
jgi:hypothetical protein